MLGAEHDSEKTGKTAKTRVRAKPDGLTPVALRAKRPLIAPSRHRFRAWALFQVFWVQESGAREGARPCARR